MADDLTIDEGELVDAPTALRLVAPLVAIGATLLVRKVLESGYTRVTGHAPPRADNRDVSLGRVLLFATVTAVGVALVNVTVERMTAPKRVD